MNKPEDQGGMFHGIKNDGTRLYLLRVHRLWVFYEAWDRYLRGEVSADVVKRRARAMLEVGIPSELKINRR